MDMAANSPSSSSHLPLLHHLIRKQRILIANKIVLIAEVDASMPTFDESACETEDEA